MDLIAALNDLLVCRCRVEQQLPCETITRQFQRCYGISIFRAKIINFLSSETKDTVHSLSKSASQVLITYYHLQTSSFSNPLDYS